MNRISLNGINVFSFRSVKELLEFSIIEKKILIAINAEKIINADMSFKDLVNKHIGYPDGIGTVLALRKKNTSAIKIPGVELWLDFIKKYNSSKSFYLIGSTQEVIEKTVEKLLAEFPKMIITNFRDGYFDTDELIKIKSDIIERKPDIVLVAMGSPRQEKLMAELHYLHNAVYIGLGGSFDIYSGLKKRAPKIFIRSGFEWLYRLLREPIRIKRQMVLLKFLYQLLFNKL